MSRNRLRKKCFIVSLGMHLLLLLVVIFGVAFATTRKKEEPVKYLSLTLHREPAPQAAPQPAQPHQARRIPVQQPVRRSDPPKPREQVKPKKPTPPTKAKTKPKKTTPKKTTKPRQTVKKNTTKRKPKPTNKKPRIPKINISDRVVIKTDTSRNTPRTTSSKPVKVVSVNPNAVNNLKNKLSSTVQAVTFLPGSSSYSNFKEWVRQKYQQTWNSGRLPSQRYRQVVTVQVTVARSGRVLSSRIVRRSGKSPLDASVQSTLNVVKTIGRSFPTGVKESRQTFTIDFQMR